MPVTPASHLSQVVGLVCLFSDGECEEFRSTHESRVREKPWQDFEVSINAHLAAVFWDIVN